MLVPLITAALVLMPMQDQFDLKCEGTETQTRNGQRTPISLVIRVDLSTRQYCAGPCYRVADIFSINADRIVFQDIARFGPPGVRETRFSSVNRRTGEYQERWSQTFPSVHYYDIQAICAPEPFSGFGQTRF